MDLTEKTENLHRHPWELSRSHNILKLLQKNYNNAVYADIGAGDKFFTLKLVPITKGKVFAIDNEYCEREEEQEGLICLKDYSLLEKNSIDCLIMMDVLEHIENEDVFLKNVFEKLKPDGKILITVPAMQFLFSSHDVFLKHHRRYDRKTMLNLLRNHDIIVEQSYYFYCSLFVLRCITLLFERLGLNPKKENVGVGLWHYNANSFITRSLFSILNFDFSVNKLFNKLHIRLPGLSLLAVCRKKS